MNSILVATSTIKDGSMLNRHDLSDASVVKNRITFLASVGIDASRATRVTVRTNQRATLEHDPDFCRYREVSEGNLGEGIYDDVIDTADALVTQDLNHALILPVADCVAAVFYSAKKQVLMVSHLGRHSLEQDGGFKSVENLIKNYSVEPSELQVWLSPAVSKESYPIWALGNKGMKEALYEQLERSGVVVRNIADNKAETDKDPLYYSYSEFLKNNRKEDGDHMIAAMMQ